MDQNPQITFGDVTVTRVKEFYGSVEMSPGQFFPTAPEARGTRTAPGWRPTSGTPGRTSAIQRSRPGCCAVRDAPSSSTPAWATTRTGPTRRCGAAWTRTYLDRLARAGVPARGCRHRGQHPPAHRPRRLEHPPRRPDLGADLPERDVPDDPAGLRLLGPGERDTRPYSAAGTRTSSRTASRPSIEAGSPAVGGHVPDRQEPAAGPRSRAHARLVGAHPGIRRRSGRCSSATWCTLRCRSWSRRPTVLLRGPGGIPRHPAQTARPRRPTTHALVFPAHFGGQGAAEVVRAGEVFAIKEWAGFARVS